MLSAALDCATALAEQSVIESASERGADHRSRAPIGCASHTRVVGLHTSSLAPNSSRYRLLSSMQ
jgi:hypothetical protein